MFSRLALVAARRCIPYYSVSPNVCVISARQFALLRSVVRDRGMLWLVLYCTEGR
jgi:hypothetical protein